MPDSYDQYTASGSTDTFSVTFGYLDPSHVTVTVDGVSEAFTFPSASQVQITSGNPSAGAIVEVRRTTPRTSQEVVWQNAANLTAGDLNTSDLQYLYITQEAFDQSDDAMQKGTSTNWDAESLKIENLATPTASTDAATKAYADTNLTLTAADVVAAEAAKTAAEAAQAAAEAAFDNFDDKFLGTKASDPTLDNDGDPLTEGVFYWNTTSNIMRVYDGSSWANMTVSPGALAALDTVGTAQIDNGAVTAVKASVASQAEAETGTDTTKLMTPERTSQAIAALSSGGVGELLGSYTASNATSVDIGSGLDLDITIDDTYDFYVVKFDLTPLTSGIILNVRTSGDGGSSFDNSAGNYQWNGIENTTGTSTISGRNDTNAAEISITQGAHNSLSIKGEFVVYKPAAATKTFISFLSNYANTSSTYEGFRGHGLRDDASAVDAFRMFANSGNVTGNVYVFGIKKS